MSFEGGKSESRTNRNPSHKPDLGIRWRRARLGGAVHGGIHALDATFRARRDIRPRRSDARQQLPALDARAYLYTGDGRRL